MTPRTRNLVGCALAISLLATGSGGVASALQDAPQDARPAADPVGDLMRNPQPAPATETPPAGTPAPVAPIIVTPLPEDAPLTPALVPEAEAEAEETAEVETVKAPEAPAKPERRQRRRVAVIQAIDKITAQSMRFEVEVGGRPVRFDQALIFTARACEISGAGEQVDDSVAYVEVTLQPRPGIQAAQPRQIFRGWMFGSAPSVSGLQHPLYDAWVVGCKA